MQAGRRPQVASPPTPTQRGHPTPKGIRPGRGPGGVGPYLPVGDGGLRGAGFDESGGGDGAGWVSALNGPLLADWSRQEMEKMEPHTHGLRLDKTTPGLVWLPRDVKTGPVEGEYAIRLESCIRFVLQDDLDADGFSEFSEIEIESGEEVAIRDDEAWEDKWGATSVLYLTPCRKWIWVHCYVMLHSVDDPKWLIEYDDLLSDPPRKVRCRAWYAIHENILSINTLFATRQIHQRYQSLPSEFAVWETFVANEDTFVDALLNPNRVREGLVLDDTPAERFPKLTECQKDCFALIRESSPKRLTQAQIIAKLATPGGKHGESTIKNALSFLHNHLGLIGNIRAEGGYGIPGR